MLTSSAEGLGAQPNTSSYVSAKDGVVGLMKTLALELVPHMIRVNSIHPTSVNTPMIMNDTIMRLFRPDLESPTVDDFAQASQLMNALPIPWVESIDVSNAPGIRRSALHHWRDTAGRRRLPAQVVPRGVCPSAGTNLG